MPIRHVIISCARTSLALADLQLQDIPDDRFARLPIGQHGPVQTNHPAFVFGHLSLYPARAMGMLGAEPPAEALTPEDQAVLFAAGAECVDDPDGSIYPKREVLVDRFGAGYAAMIQAVDQVDSDILLKANPDPKMRERFPSIGVAVNFLLTSHVMLHLGQVSAWRRIEGLGPAIK